MKKTHCSVCSHRKICWLRLKMNEVAISAQNRGMINAAWVHFEQIAEACNHYFDEEDFDD